MLLLCGFILPASTGCGDGPAGREAPERLIPAVEAVQARRGTLPLTQRLSGVVEAFNQVRIHPEVDAVVAEVLVDDGDVVTRGQALVRLRAAEFEQRLEQALASHRIAAAQLRRAEALAAEADAALVRLRSLDDEALTSAAELEGGAAAAETSAADVELARARVDQAAAAVAEARENLSRTVVRAPIAGSVGGRGAEPGMLVGPATQLFTLGRLDSVRVQVVLTDRMLDDIAEGQRAEILLAGGVRSAPLVRISPFLHPVTHTTEGRIEVDNAYGRLRPGMFVAVDVFYGESEQATLVPMSAVYEHPTLGVTGVYVADGEPPVAPGPETRAEGYLTDPLDFRFVPVQVVAEGRMEAAVRPVDADAWVVSLGQNLLGGETARARVRPVDRGHVERLQTLQREDLMRTLNERGDAAVKREDH